jgi:hypothetical protein
MSDTPAPDYGEPWQATSAREGSIVAHRDQPILESFKLVKRAVVCVNACAGMADPAAEIAAMREAIKEAGNALIKAFHVHRAITTYAQDQSEIDKAVNKEHCEMLDAALAKLQPYTKP